MEKANEGRTASRNLLKVRGAVGSGSWCGNTNVQVSWIPTVVIERLGNCSMILRNLADGMVMLCLLLFGGRDASLENEEEVLASRLETTVSC